MNIKKCFAVFACLMVLLPSFAKVLSSHEVTNLCLNSGIAGYYASVSKAAFGMVNVLFQDFLDAAAKSPKKEVPPKPENENNQNDKAIVTDNSAHKTFKTNLLPGIPLTFDIARDVYVSKITGDGNFVSLGWMILLITMLILSIKKKDAAEISLNYRIRSTHPIAA